MEHDASGCLRTTGGNSRMVPVKTNKTTAKNPTAAQPTTKQPVKKSTAKHSTAKNSTAKTSTAKKSTAKKSAGRAPRTESTSGPEQLLREYAAKRDFDKTAEPSPTGGGKPLARG